MKAVFIELPAFERYRDDYFDDDDFGWLQGALMANPEAGDLIEGTGGLRKLRFGDRRRAKGKRGGLRVIYYYWTGGPEFGYSRCMTRMRCRILRPNSERCSESA